MREHRIAWLCLGLFLACVPLANYAISHWGAAPVFPGGPHTVTLLGFTAPSGVLFVGLSFSARDGANPLGRRWVFAAIALGAVLSYFVTSGAERLAVGSAIAFGSSEGFDWLVYTPLADRGKLTAAIVASNTVGSAVDSLLFLWIAFGWAAVGTFWTDQFVLKFLMILPALAVTVPWRIQRRRRAVLLGNG